MDHILKCSSCGRKFRITDQQLRKELKCPECKVILNPNSNSPLAASPTQRPREGSKPAKRSLLEKFLGDPSAAAEGALSGALSGAIVGVLGNAGIGIYAGKETGEIVGAAVIGFVIGFGLGTPIGAFLLGSVRRMNPQFQVKAGLPVFFGGALLGSLVAMAYNGYLWAPLGAGIGGMASLFWPLLSHRLDPERQPRRREPFERRPDYEEVPDLLDELSMAPRQGPKSPQ